MFNNTHIQEVYILQYISVWLPGEEIVTPPVYRLLELQAVIQTY